MGFYDLDHVLGPQKQGVAPCIPRLVYHVLMLCLSRTGMAPSRSFSSHSDLSQMAVGAPEPIKVQVFVKGRLEQVIYCTSTSYL